MAIRIVNMLSYISSIHISNKQPDSPLVWAPGAVTNTPKNDKIGQMDNRNQAR